MEKNDIINLTIESVSNDGSGIGRYRGIAVFVPFSAVGDVLECRVLKVLKNYAYAKIEKIIVPSEVRRNPDCPVYGKCGGCTLRHINYNEELRCKEQFVKDAFSRIGGISAPVEPIISAGITSRYRNKAQYPVSDIFGAPACGFFSPRSHRVIPTDDCDLQPKIFSKITKTILKYQAAHNLPCYDESRNAGLLRHIYLRQGHYSEQIMVGLVVTEKTHAYDGLVPILLENFPKIETVLLNINPRDTNVILGESEVILYGSGKIEDRICGVEVKLSPHSFYQINTAAAELLYKKAAEFAGLSGSETLLDLYCGAGTIGLSMSRSARRLIGVEIESEAVSDARENAIRNGIKNAEFYLGDAGKISSELLKSGIHPDIIVLDPPRKGCGSEALDAVIKMSPKRVVMISCNPSTAARDVKYLKDFYYPEKISPIDLFPHTNHVETVVSLRYQNPHDYVHAVYATQPGDAPPPKEVHVEWEPEPGSYEIPGASYRKIKAWVYEHYDGMKVSSLYIAQMKAKHGIIERECYNKPKNPDARQPQCPPEKEKAIEDALRHFGMIN